MVPLPFLQVETDLMITAWMMALPPIHTNTFTLTSEFLGREVSGTLYSYLPGDAAQQPALLIFNDGQDLETMQFENILSSLPRNSIKPFVIIGVRCGTNRLQEYGVAGRPDAQKRGAKAAQYTAFVLKELLPDVQERTCIATFSETAIAGFSLGGLSAFDIAWNNPGVFNRVGVFSGSFWWRSRELNKGYTDADRIAHRMIRDTAGKPGLKFWLQTGTLDECSDRNHNGIIDSVDDTTDLMAGLYQKGYLPFHDVTYYEMVGGSHDVVSWARAMPCFLNWLFCT